jgi:hypothetical protein
MYPKVFLFDYKDLEHFAISIVKEAQDIVDGGDEVSDEIIRSAWHKKEMRKVVAELFEKELKLANVNAKEMIALGDRMGWRDSCDRLRSGDEFVRIIDRYLDIESLIFEKSYKYHMYVGILLEDDDFYDFADEAVKQLKKTKVSGGLDNTLADIVARMLERSVSGIFDDMVVVVLNKKCKNESLWDTAPMYLADIIIEEYGLEDLG